MDSIWESTALANKLLVYVGIAALVLGGILVSLFARKITEPITELASLSRRMSELDLTQGTTEAEKMRSERSGIISILCPSVWRRQFRN